MIDTTTIDTILIPDIHGRKFWGEAIPYINEGVRTIFMGDYLDPYPHEGISKRDAIENFKEILSYKDNPNVEFLLGNHDCGYKYSFFICNCRTDHHNVREIQELFWNNSDIFKLCTTVGENCIVSHAGIHNKWYKLIGGNETDTPQEVVETTNKLLRNYTNLKILLSYISSYRGGDDETSSVVWADIHEWIEDNEATFLPRQIVAHTMQYKAELTENGWKYSPSKPLHLTSQNITCIDCQECFYLDKEGELRYLKDGNVAIS